MEGPEPDDTAVLAELAGRLGKLEEQLAEFHQRSAHRESVIDRLHEENQRLHSGMERIIEAGDQDALLLRSFADDIAQILDRCGIELFSASPGDPFERGRHRPLTIVACDDNSRHNTVAEVIAAGFGERETGRVRRAAQVRVFQYTPESL
jgi:molecular chaperone GrpE